MGASASLPVVECSYIHQAGDGVTNGDIRRSPVCRNGGLKSVWAPELNTLYALFQAGRTAYPDRPCLGYRPVLPDSGASETRAATPTTPSTPAPPKATVGDFTWMTYKEVQAKIDAIASGIRALNLLKPQEDGVRKPCHVLTGFAPLHAPNTSQNRLFGIFSKNRWEWTVTEHAGYANNAANVPLYDTLGE